MFPERNVFFTVDNSGYGYDFAERFARKEHLMTAFRLSLPFRKSLIGAYGKDLFGEDALTKAGISARNTAWAKRNPIVLPEGPPTIEGPDEVNKWLIRQGATFAKSVISFPASYLTIWQSVEPAASSSSLEEKEKPVDIKLERAKNLIADYTKNGSRLKRILTFHWGRNFIQEVERVRLQQHQFRTWEEMERALATEIKDIGHGSLAQRICFINKR